MLSSYYRIHRTRHHCPLCHWLRCHLQATPLTALKRPFLVSHTVREFSHRTAHKFVAVCHRDFYGSFLSAFGRVTLLYEKEFRTVRRDMTRVDNCMREAASLLWTFPESKQSRSSQGKASQTIWPGVSRSPSEATRLTNSKVYKVSKPNYTVQGEVRRVQNPRTSTPAKPAAARRSKSR